MIKRGKRGIMQMPFGMIFSIILIVAFIVVGFYAISMFLNMQKCTKIGMFKEDLQQEIDRAWASDESSEVFSASLQSSISKVCFINAGKQAKGKDNELHSEFQLYEYGNRNMFLWPLKSACEGQRSFKIAHIDIEEITKENNPHCIDNIRGKIEIKIEKGFYDALVKIS